VATSWKQSHPMVSFGWKNAPSVDALNRDMQSLWKYSCTLGPNMSLLGIQTKIVPQLPYILQLNCSIHCRIPKQELAEMLNRLQRHTKCAPGYCEHRKKDTGATFCRFVILKHAEIFQNFQKMQIEICGAEYTQK